MKVAGLSQFKRIEQISFQFFYSGGGGLLLIHCCGANIVSSRT